MSARYSFGYGAMGSDPFGGLYTFYPIGTGLPDLCVEIDYTNDPTAGTATWENITPYVVAYSRSPVRSNEFDQPGPVTASLKLRNDDARFTPDNASGPYYGGLKKYRRVRVRASWAGVTYNRFFGYVQDWPQSWDAGGKDQTVTITASDALTPLLTYDLAGQDFPSLLSGSAVSSVLTQAGVTAQNLDAGVSTIVDSGTLSTGSYAAQRLKDIAASEMGFVYADGAGTVCFHDRHHRVTSTASTVVQGTIGDQMGEVPYVSPDPQFGSVWPIVSVTPSGGTTQTATVTAGTASYFQQTLVYPTAGSYLVSSTGEALSAAQYLSARYANPETRVNSVTLVGSRNTTLWPTILGLDTSDRVIFRRRFLENGVIGGTISLSQIVEGYGDQLQVGQDWRVTVAMSPADTQAYWVLGTSQLGTTTRLIY